jgi:flavin reductase (DIM6/NTAB) family NADH-FMN oxidoreductase RutF
MPIYDPAGRPAATNQGLLSQLVVPRPVAVISTVDERGVANVAPFSYYLPITGEPMLLGVVFGARATDGATKHTFANLLATEEMVINVCSERYATEHLETIAREYGPEVDEFAVVGWTPVASHVVRPPSVGEAPARLECRLQERHRLGGPSAEVTLVVAEVVMVVLDDRVVEGGGWDPAHPRVDLAALAPIGRSGARTFVRCPPDSVYYLERTPAP